MWSSTRDGVALDDRQPVGFDPATTVSVSRLDDEYDGYVLIEVDPRLLNWLLRGSEHAHWSDAKIGSHLASPSNRTSTSASSTTASDRSTPGGERLSVGRFET
ncbi:hypothetical protein [Halobacterium sp. CBA1126]|uniref:hypothetical protein n=1 Tax=Halobacterium sp. CBA1126 TaxID=2668074 RepID=UPI0018D203DF|nr:hypothetical protein [Halobacterium sp. CBA1126]